MAEIIQLFPLSAQKPGISLFPFKNNVQVPKDGILAPNWPESGIVYVSEEIFALPVEKRNNLIFNYLQALDF